MLYNILTKSFLEALMICCFTGHRKIIPAHMLRLPELLDAELDRLIIAGVDTFRGGGAIGFDTLAELKVIEKKKQFGFIKLELILPCRDQTKKWGERDRTIYEYIASEADSIRYITDTYTSTCMHERNRALVNGSDFCLTYLADEFGGTAYTVNYAKKNDVDVINLFNILENGK